MRFTIWLVYKRIDIKSIEVQLILKLKLRKPIRLKVVSRFLFLKDEVQFCFQMMILPLLSALILSGSLYRQILKINVISEN